MAGGESLVCRDLEHTETRNTHELLNVTPRLRDEIIPVIYATTRERNCRVGITLVLNLNVHLDVDIGINSISPITVKFIKFPLLKRLSRTLIRKYRDIDF